MKTFNFNSKETYIQFRAQWRKEYAEVSHKLRKLKNERSNNFRERKTRDAIQNVYDITALKSEARNLIDLRHKSKLEAASQYKKNLTESTV